MALTQGFVRAPDRWVDVLIGVGGSFQTRYMVDTGSGRVVDVGEIRSRIFPRCSSAVISPDGRRMLVTEVCDSNETAQRFVVLGVEAETVTLEKDARLENACPVQWLDPNTLLLAHIHRPNIFSQSYSVFDLTTWTDRPLETRWPDGGLDRP